MKIHTFTVLFALISSLMFSAVTSTALGHENLCENVLRLHIPANSDSDEDQSIKLKVRDEILNMSQDIFKGMETYDEILSAARENLPEFEVAADRVLKENGFDYTAHAEIADMYFENRTYGKYYVPEGNYTALRITLGSGKGKNWWCVMYPALCIPCFSEGNENEELIDENGEKILNSSEDEIKIKFYLAMIFEKLIGE